MWRVPSSRDRAVGRQFFPTGQRVAALGAFSKRGFFRLPWRFLAPAMSASSLECFMRYLLFWPISPGDHPNRPPPGLIVDLQSAILQ